MKRILVLCCIGILLNVQANLLTGPYSDDSARLVELARDPNASIPEKFRGQERQISLLRNFARSSDTTFTFAPKRLLYPAELQELLDYKDATLTQATIQIINQNYVNQDSKIYMLFNAGVLLDNKALVDSLLKSISKYRKSSLISRICHDYEGTIPARFINFLDEEMLKMSSCALNIRS